MDFGIYVGYWLGPRSNSYQALNILLHISMKNFWFQIAFYSVLLDARCQTSNLLTCTIPCFLGFLKIHSIRKAEVPIAMCGGLESWLDCDFSLV